MLNGPLAKKVPIILSFLLLCGRMIRLEWGYRGWLVVGWLRWTLSSLFLENRKVVSLRKHTQSVIRFRMRVKGSRDVDEDDEENDEPLVYFYNCRSSLLAVRKLYTRRFNYILAAIEFSRSQEDVSAQINLPSPALPPPPSSSQCGVLVRVHLRWYWRLLIQEFIDPHWWIPPTKYSRNWIDSTQPLHLL